MQTIIHTAPVYQAESTPDNRQWTPKQGYKRLIKPSITEKYRKSPDRYGKRRQYNDGTEPTTNSTNSKTYRYNHAYQSVTTY